MQQTLESQLKEKGKGTDSGFYIEPLSKERKPIPAGAAEPNNGLQTCRERLYLDKEPVAGKTGAKPYPRRLGLETRMLGVSTPSPS